MPIVAVFIVISDRTYPGFAVIVKTGLLLYATLEPVATVLIMVP